MHPFSSKKYLKNSIIDQINKSRVEYLNIMINSCFYYYLIKPGVKEQLLTARKKIQGKGFNLFLVDEEQQKGEEMWMLKSADLQSVYYIFNPLTGLTIELQKDNIIDLHHCKQRQGQKFKINPVLGQHEQFTITQYSKSVVILTRKGQLTCQNNSGQQQAYWIIRRVLKNRVLFDSVTIECQSSGYVMEVQDNAQKEGKMLQQRQWQGMFSQRWILDKYKQFYLIRNLKSGLVATIRNKKIKQGAELVQQKQHQNNYKYQLWSIQEKSFRLYSIRLASQQQLYLSLKNYQKQKAPIILSPQYEKYLWRIISMNKI